jgi:hypothetical protein
MNWGRSPISACFALIELVMVMITMTVVIIVVAYFLDHRRLSG